VGSYQLSAVKTVAVEDWLRTLSLAPATKAKMRSMMSALYTHAMRHEWIDRNPIMLARHSQQSGRVFLVF
jgi:site-specific recombinase XerD